MSDIKSAESSREDYLKRKENISGLLSRTIQYYENQADENRVLVFEKLQRDLENGEFSIVVVGEFSAGKSTLLNALMKKRILPSFTNETTATVNFLRHIDKAENGEAGTVFYYDGTVKKIGDATLETINKYVSTRGEEVAKNVDHLDLYLDSEFLKDGVTLVDSPGLNGIADGHREITEHQILKSHACIFLFNSDHPGSKTDFEFLHELQKKVKTIIFVLNKIDNIKEEENETVDSVIDVLKKNYKKQFPEEKTIPEIWPVAAYPALAARSDENMDYHGKKERTKEENQKLEELSKLQEFENRLFTFLTCGEKAKNQLMAPVEKVIILVNDTREELEKEKKLLEGSVSEEDIQNEIDLMNESIKKLENQLSESKCDISEKVELVRKEVEESFSAQMIKYKNRELNEIDSFEGLDDLNEYMKLFEKKFVLKVSGYSSDVNSEFCSKILQIVRRQYTEGVKEIQQDLNSQNANIQLQLHDHLDVTEHLLEVGIKEMEEEEKRLEEDLKRLKAEANKAETAVWKAKSDERKKKNLEMQLQNLKESRDVIKGQILPEVDRYAKTEYKSARGGVLGKALDFLVGEKLVERTTLETDTTVRDEAIQNRNEWLVEKQQEIDEMVKKLEKCIAEDVSVLENIHLQSTSEVEYATARLIELQKKNTEKIQEKYRKEIRKCKRILRDYCDDAESEIMRQINTVLDDRQELFCNIILGVVEAGIRQDLQTQKRKLERMKEKLAEAELDKNKRIEEIEEKIKQTMSLITDAVTLQSEVESIETDIIDNIKL